MTTATLAMPVPVVTAPPVVHIHVIRNGVAGRTLCQAPVHAGRRWGDITNHAPDAYTLCPWCEVLNEFEPLHG